MSNESMANYITDTPSEIAECIAEINSLKNDLERLRYHTFAHCLYEFEEQTGAKREDIQVVWFDGGHGYTMCTVRTEKKDYYISDEFLAGLLLDWARANGKLTEWQERR